MLGIMSIRTSIKYLFVLWTLRCIKFHIWFLGRAIETLFNLGCSRPEADLRQNNPFLKHFGSAPGSIKIQIMNQSTRSHLLLFLSRKNMADWLIFISVNERAQCKKNACWVFETVRIILIIISLICFTEKVYGSSPYSPISFFVQIKNENSKIV